MHTHASVIPLSSPLLRLRFDGLVPVLHEELRPTSAIPPEELPHRRRPAPASTPLARRRPLSPGEPLRPRGASARRDPDRPLRPLLYEE